jgi:hypothetical protein
MVAESVEQRLKTLEHEFSRMKAVIEIQNLMGRYVYWHSSGQNDKKGKFIAQKTPGTRVEYITSGVFEGSQGMQRFLVDLHSGVATPDKRKYDGSMAVHPISTPVIEVAGDGKTARGLWISFGVEVGPNIDGKFDKPLQPLWVLEEYAADFVKEDGVWKWWRIHLFRVFQCPFDKAWTEIDCQDYFDNVLQIRRHFDRRGIPDRPTTMNQMYSPTKPCLMMEGIPPAPEPYETYEEWMAVVKKAD